MQDLKQCINKVHIAKPTDFPTQQSYDTWQKREIKQLSELLKTLSLLDPNLPTADTPAHASPTLPLVILLISLFLTTSLALLLFRAILIHTLDN